IATVSLELAGAGGAASAAAKRIVQRASDRRMNDLIGKNGVLDIRRIRRAAQDNETKSALLGRDRQSATPNIQKLHDDDFCDLQSVLWRDFRNQLLPVRSAGRMDFVRRT